jgi:glucose uptake protein GlcU
MRSPWYPLRIAAGVELVSVVLLFVNLATVHWQAVSSVVGPTHGCAYLFVIVATVRATNATTPTKLTALIPAIGGLLVLRQLKRQLRLPAASV